VCWMTINGDVGTLADAGAGVCTGDHLLALRAPLAGRPAGTFPGWDTNGLGGRVGRARWGSLP
jgi:hypothetical protein